MIRTRLSRSWIKRTIRPLYPWAATPKSAYLDPNFDRSYPVYPGMGVYKTTGENVMPMGGYSGGAGTTNAVPYGLIANYVGGDGIDELLDAGINTTAVWTLGPDSEFEILAPAFDSNLTWTDGSGSGAGPTLVYVCFAATGTTTPGQLCTSALSTSNRSTAPVARLLKVNSATKITIGGLQGTSA